MSLPPLNNSSYYEIEESNYGFDESKIRRQIITFDNPPEPSSEKALRIFNQLIVAIKNGLLRCSYSEQVEDIYERFNHKLGLFGRFIAWIRGFFVETYVSKVDKAYQSIMGPFNLRLKEMEKGLFEWLRDQNFGGNKVVATNKILTAFKENNYNLDLSDLGLTSLPKEIGLLNDLEVLQLNNNKLSSLPMELSKLTRLEQLYLQNNNIEKLQDAILELKTLKLLILSDNKISELPPNIKQLDNLGYFELNRNPGIKLPNEIVELVKLEALYWFIRLIDVFGYEDGAISA